MAGAHHSTATKAGAKKFGERWPDRLPDDIAKARFTAIGPAEIAAGLAAKFPLLVQAAPTSGPANAQDLTLVRPDGYVGFAGAASDRTSAEAYLQALAARERCRSRGPPSPFQTSLTPAKAPWVLRRSFVGTRKRHPRSGLGRRHPRPRTPAVRLTSVHACSALAISRPAIGK